MKIEHKRQRMCMVQSVGSIAGIIVLFVILIVIHYCWYGLSPMITFTIISNFCIMFLHFLPS